MHRGGFHSIHGRCRDRRRWIDWALVGSLPTATFSPVENMHIGKKLGGIWGEWSKRWVVLIVATDVS